MKQKCKDAKKQQCLYSLGVHDAILARMERWGAENASRDNVLHGRREENGAQGTFSSGSFLILEIAN